MIKDIQLIKNYNKIWNKIEKLMKKDFNTKTTYGDDDKHIKTRIKTYKDSITTNSYNKKGLKKVPEEKIPHKCLSIMIVIVAIVIVIVIFISKNKFEKM